MGCECAALLRQVIVLIMMIKCSYVQQAQLLRRRLAAVAEEHLCGSDTCWQLTMHGGAEQHKMFNGLHHCYQQLVPRFC